MVDGYVFPLSPLWKYAGKWGHTWRVMDECGERCTELDDFLILYSLMFCLISLDEDERTKFLIMPAL